MDHEFESYIFRIFLELFVGLYMLGNTRHWKTDKLQIVFMLMNAIPLLYLSIVTSLMLLNMMTMNDFRDYTSWTGVVLFFGIYASHARMQSSILKLLKVLGNVQSKPREG